MKKEESSSAEIFTPEIWRKQKIRAISVHTLPSGQKVKIKGMLAADFIQSGMMPLETFRNFKKLEERSKAKAKKDELNDEDFFKDFNDKDLELLKDVSSRLAVMAVIEPALTFDVTKEPEKFPVQDIHFFDLMAIAGIVKAGMSADPFFREPGPDIAHSSDVKRIRNEAEPVPERVVE